MAAQPLLAKVMGKRQISNFDPLWLQNNSMKLRIYNYFAGSTTQEKSMWYYDNVGGHNEHVICLMFAVY